MRGSVYTKLIQLGPGLAVVPYSLILDQAQASSSLGMYAEAKVLICLQHHGPLLSSISSGLQESWFSPVEDTVHWD